MTLINTITSNASQNIVLVLADGTEAGLHIWYCDNQKGWFHSLSYGNFTNYNRRLVVCPNMIREFREILPFGLGCMSTDGYEPILLDDFSSGRVKLYLLNSDDVAEYEAMIRTAKGIYVG